MPGTVIVGSVLFSDLSLPSVCPTNMGADSFHVAHSIFASCSLGTGAGMGRKELDGGGMAPPS